MKRVFGLTLLLVGWPTRVRVGLHFKPGRCGHLPGTCIWQMWAFAGHAVPQQAPDSA
jgi:hypothetical protein